MRLVLGVCWKDGHFVVVLNIGPKGDFSAHAQRPFDGIVRAFPAWYHIGRQLDFDLAAPYFTRVFGVDQWLLVEDGCVGDRIGATAVSGFFFAD